MSINDKEDLDLDIEISCDQMNSLESDYNYELQQTNRLTENKIVKSKKHKTIRINKGFKDDIDELPIPDEVKNEALKISEKVGKETKRGKQRRFAVWFLVYNAYRTLGIPIDAYYIANMVGVPKSDIKKAYNVYSPVDTGYTPPLIFTTPQDLIPTYCKQLNFDPDTIPHVIEIADQIINKEPVLLEKPPRNVAAGIIFLYMEIYFPGGSNNSTTRATKLSRAQNMSDIVGISKPTIETQYTAVRSVYMNI